MSDWFNFAISAAIKGLDLCEKITKEAEYQKQKEAQEERAKKIIKNNNEINRIRRNTNDIEKYPIAFSRGKFERAKEARKLIDTLDAEWKLKSQPYILIDSNIWMDASIDDFFVNFFEFIKEANLKVTIPDEQFDEIVNLKNKPYKEEKSKLARLAMARIETYLDSKLLHMKLKSHVADTNAYLDVIIIKNVIEKAKNGVNVFLFTKDKEIILRIKSEDIPLENIHFLDIQDTLIKISAYKESKETINEYNILKKRFYSQFVIDL